MTPLLEKVARAVAEITDPTPVFDDGGDITAFVCHDDSFFDTQNVAYAKTSELRARAALLALSDPPEEVIEAMARAIWEDWQANGASITDAQREISWETLVSCGNLRAADHWLKEAIMHLT